MCDNFLFQIDKSRQQTKLPFFVFLLSLTFSDIKEAAQIPLNQFIIKKPQGFFNTHEHNFVVNILLSNRCIGTYNISIETHFAELISNALYYRRAKEKPHWWKPSLRDCYTLSSFIESPQ